MTSDNDFGDPFADPFTTQALQQTPEKSNPITMTITAIEKQLSNKDQTKEEDPIPCPCLCECGNYTQKTFGQIQSLNAVKQLRCDFCAEKFHFGKKWEKPNETLHGIGKNDRIVKGKYGNIVVIREPYIDPQDIENNKKIAKQLAEQRREESQDRWLKSLPERWQLPYDHNESLAPEIEDRLNRIKTNGVTTYGTSLICFGPFGSGKTWAAYSYARSAIDQWLLWPKEITIGTEAEIMEPLALSSPWELQKVTKQLLHPDLKMLLIDDVGTLGTYKDPATRHAAWIKVINWMYEHKRTLILTTNKTLGKDQGLDQWIGSTAYERLRHMAGPTQVYRDEDKRGEMAAKWEAEYQASHIRNME